ncbi:MAG: hypothetical protein K8T89_25910 [Planctomycetes bacterium]|nr:hypothetical protein [Planctomycetota bacterium]
MSRISEWKAGFRGFIFSIMLAALGCGESKKTSLLPTVDEPKPVERNQIDAGAPDLVLSFLNALKDGTAVHHALTPEFKRKIAPPRPSNAADKELGFNPDALQSYFKQWAQGTYPVDLTYISATPGPCFYGIVELNNGKHEGYCMRLAPDPADKKFGFSIDWFQRTSFCKEAYNTDDPGPELVGAQIVAQCFLENLLGGDLQLAGALLAKKWKARECPPKSADDADLGYSHVRLIETLRLMKGEDKDFSFTKRDITAGKPAVFEIFTIDAELKPQRVFTLTVAKENGDWQVQEIVVVGPS